ncbi:thiosulfate sulfurtransferase/rhodanese-like domain-containing protein 3 [Myxocyprinus asiaticus]|uniref:thiosulfate sulfurtransferase/rhodanese-like domain-containing protein 3 n=1 Tax=Myxocyprinus asiaticus TaxID=70543 RepID=UPI0022221D24|nr:thiosulfate sulfurtransferase/rhodanese-like domain-containing protein 3 [Myxocyprinus asiaticus]XP_051576662.1 thiosulfate sulfurtransferase/rhodanese-like domain-containing protein 3 [Myxocyprinus asiaticus]
MALNVCSRLTMSIPLVLASRNVVPVTRLPATGSCWTHLRCLHQTRAIRFDGGLLRNFSSSSQPSIDVSYDQLKKLLVSRSGVVIDVREPWELREYGNIPGSINVPLGQVNGALQLKSEVFKEKFGGDMPTHSQNIVFTCLAGVRSKTALDTAVVLGYTNVQHYPGGWQDWAERERIQTKV